MKKLLILFLLIINVTAFSQIIKYVNYSGSGYPVQNILSYGVEYFQVKDLPKYVKLITADGKYFLVRKVENGNTIPDVSDTYYTLDTNVTGNGDVIITPSGSSFIEGSIVQLNAVPEAGNNFASWGGSISGSTNPYSLTMNANKTVNATFSAPPPTVEDSVHIIICGYGGAHDDSVASAFRKGYLLSGSAFNDSLQLRVETLQSSFVYAYANGTKMIIRSTSGLSTGNRLQPSYYPIQLVMPAGSNSYVQVYFSGGTLPATIVTGAGDLANETGYDIEFYSADPIYNDTQDYSSFSNGYIAGAIYGIAEHTDGSIWTARYLLRQILGDTWTNTNGYGKITSTVVTNAIASYDSETNYDALDPY